MKPDVRPGGFARAVFNGQARTVPTLPEKAVNFDADGASVMIYGADQRVHRQRIHTGERSGGYVELLEGPAVGTQVVLGGAAFLLDGDHVRAAGAVVR